MKPFFRIIRKSSVGLKGTRKYLVYAFGEAFLIVVGILIALQISNWNEERKNRVKEQFYLKALFSEQQENREIAEDLRKYQAFQKSNGEIVLDAYMKQVYPDDPRDLIVAIDHTGWLFPPSFSKNVWDELNYTGGVTLLRNDSLRNELSAIYSAFDYVTGLHLQFNHFLYSYRDATASVIDPYLRKEINNKLDPRELQNELEPIPNIDETIERLEQVDKLDAHISNVIMKAEPLIILYTRYVEDIDDLMTQIQLEIK